jgi:hypothetical protein
MKRYEAIRTGGFAAVMLFAGVLALTPGCVERRVVYVPAYQSPPVYQAQTAYPAQPPATNGQAVAVSPSTPNAPPGTVIVTQAPPPAQVEVVPVAPGPDYYWLPGYWSWQGGGWMWIGGYWGIRPWHGAVWVHGGWGRYGGGWGWRGGHWR